MTAPSFVMLTPLRGEAKLVATDRITEVRVRAGGKARVWLRTGAGLFASTEAVDVTERFDAMTALLTGGGHDTAA